MRRTASVFRPDNNLPDVSPKDIMTNCIEDRHLGDDEIRPLKSAMVEDNVATPFVIHKDITTGAADVKIFDTNAPFKFEILDVIIQPRGASVAGTMKLTDGTNDITNEIDCAIDTTIGRVATINNAYSTIAKNGSLSVVCDGTVVADTIGLVTIICAKVD